MQRTCQICRADYDDAIQWTFCPHERFISEEDLERKELALSLIGKDLVWNHEPDGAIVRIQSIGHNGMVTLAGWPGEFAPHLFQIRSTAEPSPASPPRQ